MSAANILPRYCTRFSRLPQLLAAATVLTIAATLLACGGYGDNLIEQSISKDPIIAGRAVTLLRGAGQAGLEVLCAEHDRLVREATGSGQPDTNADTIANLRRAIDTVARQRDAYASRLFWHTDFNDAKAMAQATGRPILSLRLLGKLDEDLSCANSRFFRSVLYANRDVSDYLREHFVLHWQSLRPVPHITIDFGDGRQIKRTITGNSVHYVLDADGNLVDAIPGLHAPAAFLSALQSAEAAARSCATATDETTRRAVLTEFHHTALRSVDTAWQSDMARLNPRQPLTATPVKMIAPAGAAPIALNAAAVAPSKMFVERRALNAVFAISLTPPPAITDADAQLWESIAALHESETALDASSIALMREKVGVHLAQAAGGVTHSKRDVEDPFIAMLRTFRQSLAADTVQNQYVIHRAIHQWLADGVMYSSAEVDAFNQRVYADLFLSPLDDPWMGLAPADVYAAVDANGLQFVCK